MIKMLERYNIDIDSTYLNDCTYEKKCGMFPTVEIVEQYNIVNMRPSILPSTENSELRALFAQVIPSTADNLYALNRFKKLVGYKNVMFPLSKRYPSLQEISNELTTLTTIHDVSNYQRFERMLEIITQKNNIPLIYDSYSKYTHEKTETPNETITTSGEKSKTDTISDTLTIERELSETDALDRTDTKTGTETEAKTGTEATAHTGTESKTGTEATAHTGTKSETDDNVRTMGGSDTTTETQRQTIAQEKVNAVTTFDDVVNFNNDNKTDNNSTINKNISETVSYGQTITDDGDKLTTFNNTDTTTHNTTLTHNTTDTTTHNTENTTTYNTELAIDSDETKSVAEDTTHSRAATNTGSEEIEETKTRTGENAIEGSGDRFSNRGLSMQELIARENLLMPVFDLYLLSIAKEITLSCIEEIW